MTILDASDLVIFRKEADILCMIIRQMTHRDLYQVRLLCGELGYVVTPTEIAERYQWINASHSNSLAVAENKDGQVIGWIHVATTLALTDAVRAEIVGIVVTESYRRKGIGKQLMRYAEEWARTRGHVRIRVRSQALRENTQEFYTDIGYDLRKIQNVFVKELRGTT